MSKRRVRSAAQKAQATSKKKQRKAAERKAEQRSRRVNRAADMRDVALVESQMILARTAGLLAGCRRKAPQTVEELDDLIGGDHA